MTIQRETGCFSGGNAWRQAEDEDEDEEEERDERVAEWEKHWQFAWFEGLEEYGGSFIEKQRSNL